MAISREPYDRKAPSQQPKDFFNGDQQGGADGRPTRQPDKPASGTLREKIYGNEKLNKQ